MVHDQPSTVWNAWHGQNFKKPVPKENATIEFLLKFVNSLDMFQYKLDMFFPPSLWNPTQPPTKHFFQPLWVNGQGVECHLTWQKSTSCDGRPHLKSCFFCVNAGFLIIRLLSCNACTKFSNRSVFSEAWAKMGSIKNGTSNKRPCTEETTTCDFRSLGLQPQCSI